MRLPLVLAALLALPVAAQQNLLSTLQFTPIVSGINEPTSIAHAGDGSRRLFITGRAGRIWIVDANQQLLTAPFLDIRDKVGDSGGEQGLLSVAFHPNYRANGRFFVNYTNNSGDTVVSQYLVTSNANRADSASEQIFFTADQPFPNHNGGQLQFGPDGMLYIGMGDGGSGGDPNNYAQTLSSPLGKLLRFDVDQGPPARAPADNPFVSTPGAEPGTWAYGLRNPWRFTFDRANGDMWIADVGQNQWEEVNYVPAGSTRGRNYGWRRMEGLHCFNPGTNCNDGSLTLPVMEYSHNAGACSVTGGYRYRGARHPGLQGVYFFADLCGLTLHAGVETTPGLFQRLAPRSIGRSISTFGEDEAGEVYFADYGAGQIFRIDAPPQEPRISQGGVVNAASFAVAQSVAPGSIVSVFGTGLANATADAPQAPLPAELGGARFAFNGILAAPVFFASPGQANVQIPWELAGAGAAQLTAFSNGFQSASVTVSLAPAGPGVFTMDQTGGGQAAVLISGTGLLAALAGSFPNARAAREGEYLEIFANGLGSVTNRPATGAASPSSPLAETQADVMVRLGDGALVAASFAGLAPGFVGLYQVNVPVAAGAPSGPAVPLALIVGGAESNTVTIAIE
jgi:uncharacterized protein (TIGR03437 family)